MIVETLKEMRDVSMIDGCFDPIHQGHVFYFEMAKALGDPVFCNITGDEYLTRKHTPLLSHQKRALVLNAIRHLDFVFMSDRTTAEVLSILKPKRYVKGNDWLARGLPEKELEVCKIYGIEIIYLDTVVDSSSEILKKYEGINNG